MVFIDGTNDHSRQQVEHTTDGSADVCPIISRTSITCDKGGKPGAWHWLPRV